MFKLLILSSVLGLLYHQLFCLALDDIPEVEEDNLDVNQLNDTDIELIPQIRQASLYINNKIYTVMYSYHNWHSALELCSSQNMILASITNDDDNKKLLAVLLQNNLFFSGSSFWLGGSDVGHNGRWFWVSTGRPIFYTSWRPSEPNNAGGNEHCMELLDNGKWNDVNCNAQRQVICENRCPLDSYEVPIY